MKIDWVNLALAIMWVVLATGCMCGWKPNKWLVVFAFILVALQNLLSAFGIK